MDRVREYIFYNGVYIDKAILSSVNHLSLKKIAKKIGSVAKDAVKMGTAPIKLAVSSVTGKPANITYDTKVGKVIGGIHDKSTQALTATVKRVGDTITLGGATKLANVVRKDQYKEKVGEYNELKALKEGPKSGIKIFDKAAEKIGGVTQVAGTIAGGYTLASGIKTLAGKTKIPTSILNQAAEKVKLGLEGDADSLRDTGLLNDMIAGNEEVRGEDNRKLAGFGSVNPIFIIVAVILLVILASSSKGSKTSKSYRRK